jgi:hypothetical protein
MRALRQRLLADLGEPTLHWRAVPPHKNSLSHKLKQRGSNLNVTDKAGPREGSDDIGPASSTPKRVGAASQALTSYQSTPSQTPLSIDVKPQQHSKPALTLSPNKGNQIIEKRGNTIKINEPPSPDDMIMDDHCSRLNLPATISFDASEILHSTPLLSSDKGCYVANRWDEITE